MHFYLNCTFWFCILNASGIASCQKLLRFFVVVKLRPAFAKSLAFKALNGFDFSTVPILSRKEQVSTEPKKPWLSCIWARAHWVRSANATPVLCSPPPPPQKSHKVVYSVNTYFCQNIKDVYNNIFVMVLMRKRYLQAYWPNKKFTMLKWMQSQTSKMAHWRWVYCVPRHSSLIQRSSVVL